MPTKILEIPVDDADFKKFLGLWTKYQQELKSQPEAWKDVNTGIAGVTSTADDYSKSLENVFNLVERISKAEDARELRRQTAAERQKRDSSDKARQEEQESNRRRSALNQVREYGRNISDIAKKGGSWATGAAEGALGGIAGGGAGLIGSVGGMLKSIPVIGGILGGAAMAAFEASSALTGDRQASRSVGVNVSTLQGWKNSMASYLPAGSAENLLSTVSEAQASPGGGGLFARFGIKNYNNKNVSDISVEMLQNAQKYLKGHPGSQGLMGARSLYGGALDTGTLRTLQTMSPQELQDAIDKMKKFSKDNANADDAATKAAQFLTTTERGAATALDQFGGALVSSANQVSQALQGLFNTIQPFLRVQHKWQNTNIAKDTENMFHLTVTPHEDPTSKQRRAIRDAYSGALLASGMSPGLVRGILGNVEAESSYNPFAHVTDNKGKLHYGMVQWSPERAAAYTQHFGHTMMSVKDPIQAAKEQAWLTSYELTKGRYASLGKRLQGANAYDAGSDLATNYETPATPGSWKMWAISKARGLSSMSMELPGSDTGHVAKTVAEAVKKGVVHAHRSMHGGHTTVKIKTQSKPGSDTTVSARQVAGQQ